MGTTIHSETVAVSIVPPPKDGQIMALERLTVISNVMVKSHKIDFQVIDPHFRL